MNEHVRWIACCLYLAIPHVPRGHVCLARERQQCGEVISPRFLAVTSGCRVASPKQEHWRRLAGFSRSESRQDPPRASLRQRTMSLVVRKTDHCREKRFVAFTLLLSSTPLPLSLSGSFTCSHRHQHTLCKGCSTYMSTLKQ